jgi:2-C-methyl-D-erythritol 4-phosphate cytidylyltransferase
MPMAVFSVLVLTAAPTGQAAEAGGAFVKVDGREALMRSIELFLNRDNVKQVQLAVLPEAQEEVKRKFGGHLGLTGVKLVSGGPRWIDQIIAAGPKISPEATHIIVHDAARPAVAYSDIDALMEAAAKHPAVALTAPVRSAVVETDEGGNALAVHPPTHFVQLLTPQAFSREMFMELVSSKQEAHPSKLTLVKGSPLNIRISGAGDAGLAKAMIGMLPRPKIKASDNPFEEAQW